MIEHARDCGERPVVDLVLYADHVRVLYERHQAAGHRIGRQNVVGVRVPVDFRLNGGDAFALHRDRYLVGHGLTPFAKRSGHDDLVRIRVGIQKRTLLVEQIGDFVIVQTQRHEFAQETRHDLGAPLHALRFRMGLGVQHTVSLAGPRFEQALVGKSAVCLAHGVKGDLQLVRELARGRKEFARTPVSVRDHETQPFFQLRVDGRIGMAIDLDHGF